jgi:hypothetical protein
MRIFSKATDRFFSVPLSAPALQVLAELGTLSGNFRWIFPFVKPEDIEQAKKMVRESVEIYNTRRPQHIFL